jgi:hypothetical protein
VSTSVAADNLKTVAARHAPMEREPNTQFAQRYRYVATPAHIETVVSWWD